MKPCKMSLVILFTRNERLLKQQSVNKLVQIVTEKRPDTKGSKGPSKDELRKAQKQVKDIRKKMQEAENIHRQTVKNKEDEITSLQHVVSEETQRAQELHMELQVIWGIFPVFRWFLGNKNRTGSVYNIHGISRGTVNQQQ